MIDLYISPTGSDATGDGSSAAPWLNADHACAWARDNLDLGGFVVTLHVLSSYSGIAGWTFKGPLVGATVTPAAASGRRYNASQNGIVFTGGSGGPNFFPGDVAGAVSSGGYYQ